MKKEYLQPEMNVVKITVGTLLAGSGPDSLFDDIEADGNESLAPGMDIMTPGTLLGIPGL